MSCTPRFFAEVFLWLGFLIFCILYFVVGMSFWRRLGWPCSWVFVDLSWWWILGMEICKVCMTVGIWSTVLSMKEFLFTAFLSHVGPTYTVNTHTLVLLFFETGSSSISEARTWTRATKPGKRILSRRKLGDNYEDGIARYDSHTVWKSRTLNVWIMKPQHIATSDF